jgi:hypothetical protein
MLCVNWSQSMALNDGALLRCISLGVLASSAGNGVFTVPVRLNGLSGNERQVAQSPMSRSQERCMDA